MTRAACLAMGSPTATRGAWDSAGRTRMRMGGHRLRMARCVIAEWTGAIDRTAAANTQKAAPTNCFVDRPPASHLRPSKPLRVPSTGGFSDRAIRRRTFESPINRRVGVAACPSAASSVQPSAFPAVWSRAHRRPHGLLLSCSSSHRRRVACREAPGERFVEGLLAARLLRPARRAGPFNEFLVRHGLPNAETVVDAPRPGAPPPRPSDPPWSGSR